jgi:hypothetical protein
MHRFNRMLAVAAIVALHACGTHDGGDFRTPAAPAVAQLPMAVQKALADYLAICTEVGGQPDAAAGVWRRDLNGDGITDYVIDGHAITCKGAYTAWGDRAKQVSVFTGDSAGEGALAFDGLTWGVSLEGDPDATLWLGVSSEACGKPAAADFASESFCERPLQWNSATRRFDYAPLATIRPLR